jgi:deoxyribose-phosphate aldolase
MTDSAPRAIRLDHRLTAPLSTLLDLESGAALTVEYGVASLTASPWLVRAAARMLAHTPIRLGVVVGADGSLASSKAEAASRALEQGARDIEVGINGGMLLSGNEAGVLAELTGVVDLAHSALARAAIALPMGFPEAAIWRACLIAEQSGADRLVARIEDDIALVRSALGPRLELEAVADHLDPARVMAARAAGADVVGGSLDEALLDEIAPRPLAVAG